MKKPQKGKPPVTRSRKSLIPPEPFRCEISWAHELSTLKSSPNKMPEKWITLRLTGMVLKEEAALLQKCVEALLRIPHQKIILYLGRLPTISGRGLRRCCVYAVRPKSCSIRWKFAVCTPVCDEHSRNLDWARFLACKRSKKIGQHDLTAESFCRKIILPEGKRFNRSKQSKRRILSLFALLAPVQQAFNFKPRDLIIFPFAPE